MFVLPVIWSFLLIVMGTWFGRSGVWLKPFVGGAYMKQLKITRMWGSKIKQEFQQQ